MWYWYMKLIISSKKYHFKNKLANGFYDDGVSLGCLACDPICATCDGST